MNPTAKLRYLSTFRPSVPVRKGRKCSWKHHFIGWPKELVGYDDHLASKNPSRFVYAGCAKIGKHRGKYSSNLKVGIRTSQRIRHLLRELHLISVPGQGLNNYGNLVAGFVMADHDKCCHLEDGICTVVLPDNPPTPPSIFTSTSGTTSVDTQRSPHGRAVDAQWSPDGHPVDTKWTPRGRRMVAAVVAPMDTPVVAPVDTLVDAPKTIQIPSLVEDTKTAEEKWQAPWQDVGSTIGSTNVMKTHGEPFEPSEPFDSIDSLEPLEPLEPLNLSGTPNASPSTTGDGAENPNDKVKTDSLSGGGPSESSESENQDQDSGHEKTESVQPVRFENLLVRNLFGADLLGEWIAARLTKPTSGMDIDNLAQCIAPDLQVAYSEWTAFAQDLNLRGAFLQAIRDVYSGYESTTGKLEKAFAAREVTPINRFAFMMGIATRFAELQMDGDVLPRCWIKLANDFKREHQRDLDSQGVEYAAQGAQRNCLDDSDRWSNDHPNDHQQPL